ncbi:hypothetical protein FY034_18125 (plasmid) [Trichlorobacter lovleyi]|uniref:hypothetical protein n=1 Tax=Trichlorobacter lovleyi TaxID=313985 RepID=UPI00223FA01D|nr:hypothetical protein [Trichlorobacter lovleyi]QOX80919.1 hypothetical protein FY034_18125 [Trichlorobacter lovleyi]
MGKSKGIKKSRCIYLSEQALETLEQFKHESWNASAIISSALIRYYSVLERECPQLKKNEWLAICDVANALPKHTDSRQHDPARFLWASIEGAAEVDGLSEKWEIDGKELAYKIKAMSYVQQCAIIEVASLFWCAPGSDYSEMLAFAKANITEQVGQINAAKDHQP